MKRILTIVLMIYSAISYSQNTETFSLRIAPQVTIDLAAQKGKAGFGTYIGFVNETHIESSKTTFLLEAGYSYKGLKYGDNTLGSNIQLHGLNIGAGWSWGGDWRFSVGPYVNMIMGIRSNVTINKVETELTAEQRNNIGIRNVDIGSTLRLSRKLSERVLVELNVDNTLINLIESGETQIYPMSAGLGLRIGL